jgi:hypothetical protein
MSKTGVLAAVLAGGLVLAGAADVLAGSKVVQQQAPLGAGEKVVGPRGGKVRPEMRPRRALPGTPRVVGPAPSALTRSLRAVEGAPKKSEVLRGSKVQAQTKVDMDRSRPTRDSKVLSEKKLPKVVEGTPLSEDE